MTTRVRTLAVGGVLLAVVGGGLLVGFLTLGNDNGASGAAETTPPTSPSESPTDQRAEVEQAYLDHWYVYAEALLTLNGSRLPEVFAGAALREVQKQVDDLAEANQPARVRIEHRYRITIIDATTATVEDRYINHTVRLDPETMEPIEDDPNQRVHKSYTLKKVDDVWKVTDIVLYQ
ncbi:MAG TPA: hypothetical protein VEL05_05880 [Candidatus Acidoferrum sp.]|nr:hypothetical protein [Candidatus Acidoferrum sp.]